jgi:hypothetical protein
MLRSRTIWLVIGALFVFFIVILAIFLLARFWAGTPSARPSGPASPSAHGSGTPFTTPSVSMYPLLAPGSTANAWPTATHTELFGGQVPPTPLLTGLRTGTHSDAGYDRIAFDFQQDLPPGYTIKYVDQAVRSASGQPIVITGNSILQIDFTPATAHNSAGHTPASPPTDPEISGYHELESFVMSGDFEGHVTFDMGLADKGGFQVKQFQPTPGHWTIYVDMHVPGV